MRFFSWTTDKQKKQRIEALADTFQLEIYKTIVAAVQGNYESGTAKKIAAGIANYIMQFGLLNELHATDRLLVAQIELELARCSNYFSYEFQQNLLGCIILLASLQQIPLSKHVEHIRNLHRLNLFVLGPDTPDVGPDLPKRDLVYMFEITTITCEKLPSFFSGFIDPPGPYGQDASEWREFLDDLSNLPDSVQIRELKVEALEALGRIS